MSEYLNSSKIASMALGEWDKIPSIFLASFLLFVEQPENSTHNIIKTHGNFLFFISLSTISFFGLFVNIFYAHWCMRNMAIAHVSEVVV